MKITDEMIQAGIDAEARVLRLQESHRIEWEPTVRKTVTAALHAALGDVEPLEDAVGDGGTIEIVRTSSGCWYAAVGQGNWEAANTLDAAIRIAGANAKGGE